MTVDINITPQDLTAITGLDETTMQGMCKNRLDEVCAELGHEMEMYVEHLVNRKEYDLNGMFAYVAGKAYDGTL